jgi:hypothetical protein
MVAARSRRYQLLIGGTHQVGSQYRPKIASSMKRSPRVLHSTIWRNDRWWVKARTFGLPANSTKGAGSATATTTSKHASCVSTSQASKNPDLPRRLLYRNLTLTDNRSC